MKRIIEPKQKVSGQITPPGDKSISHRSVMAGALAEGTTRVKGFLMGADCLATVDCFSRLGVEIEANGDFVKVRGRGLYGLKEYGGVLYTVNSGTTTRILSGILCGQNFPSVIDGDESIRSRPMRRIIEPLRLMNAWISAREDNFCPLHINPSRLKGIDYALPVASAQLKSCLLFAGLYADGHTVVREAAKSRDHTELMLKEFGADIEVFEGGAAIRPSKLAPADVEVPGDISSASYFIVLALLADEGELLIKNVGVNPTRTGIIDALKEMGGDIELFNHRMLGREPACDIHVRPSRLKGVVIEGDIIPRLIDEIPILSVAAARAEGKMVIKGAGELKFKETNRIKAIAEQLGKCGAKFIETDDGIIIEGEESLKGAAYNSLGDHRIAMSAAVAAAVAEGPSEIEGAECVDVSYPGFFEDLERALD
jgi:3-phosphoshikimate 1-carboxyvinyltransferase